MRVHLQKERDKAVIDKFQSLLRSGMDYDAYSMYEEAGRVGFITWEAVRKIVGRHYKELLTSEMIEYVNGLSCTHSEEVECFAEKFEMCERESRIFIRYIKRMK